MLVRALPTKEKLVALTFDACQTEKPAGYEPKIIAILKKSNTPATLFLGGRWMEAHAEITKQLASEPLFEIATHSYLHPHFTKISQSAMRADLEKTLLVHQKLTRKTPRLFRPPYGDQNPAVVSIAESVGLTTVLWSVVTGDPDPKISASGICSEVWRQLRPGGIVIQHINGRGWHSPEALPTLLAGLKQRGYRCVRISDVLRTPNDINARSQ
jgi:peptidoglycan-N-acetylglucosamine deacetylase